MQHSVWMQPVLGLQERVREGLEASMQQSEPISSWAGKALLPRMKPHFLPS